MQIMPVSKKLAKMQELAVVALEYFPITFTPSDARPGRKAYFGIPLSEDPEDLFTDYVHIFAESKLAGPPKDKGVGFTQEDVIDLSGVYVFKRDDRTVVGQTFELENLLDLIPDLSLRNRIVCRVHGMRQMIHLDDEFLAAASLDWAACPSAAIFGFKTLQ